MAKQRQITLKFPLGGVERRVGFQSGQIYYTPAALNVYPDDVVTGRARGGARPGLSKAVTTDRDSWYQFINSVNVDRGTGVVEYQRVLIAGSNGHLLRMDEGETTWTEVSGGPYINPAVPIEVAIREQKVYIADYANVNGTDLTVDSGYNQVVTSASIGAWSTAGITSANATQWKLEVIDPGNGTAGTYTITSYQPTFTDDTITVTADAGGSIVEKSDASPAWPAWAAAGTITFDSVAYTVKTRTDDDTLVLDNTTVTAVGGTTYSLALLNTQLLLGSSPGATSTTAIPFRLHRTPKVWDLDDDTVITWATENYVAGELGVLGEPKGSVPTDCSLIAEYRDRLVLAGDVYNPHRWYAPRSGNPLDFDYGFFDATSATAYSNYLGGQIGEPIRALIPHGYDCLIMGAEDAIYVMKGDPANTGSQLVKVDDVVGVLSANAWCKTADDTTVMLTRDGLCQIPSGCGQPPISISREKIPRELLALDPDDWFINLVYDPLLRSIHIWVIENDGATPAVATCWLYHWEQKAFWPVTLPAGMQPTAAYDFSPLGTSDKSSVLLGGYDGLVRQFDRDAVDDDGTDFTSYIRIGPFMLSPNSDNKGTIQKLRIVMGANSGAATWGFGAASTMEGIADQLEADTHFQTGTVDAYAIYPRVQGHAGMLEIGANGAAAQWIFEEAVVQIREAGKMRT